jgi:hypothetical protein
MGAHRIELSGFSDTMRDRLRAFGLFGEITAWKLRMFVPTDASGVGVLAKCSNVTRSNGSVNGKPRDAARRFRTGTPPRARGRGGVPPLSLNGKREGRYWLVGDVRNTPGRSLFVRLQDSPKGPAGKWTDAATSEHGDLLDIIRESLGLRDFREVADEARRFLNLPRTEPQPELKSVRPPVVAGSQEAARRLFAISQPIEGTVVEAYLQRRGIVHVYHGGSLRFHPHCYYRPDEHLPTETWPAMIACVTDLNGRITGVHRTWLDPDGFDRIRLGKAPIDTPRRAMGDLLGNAVRLGVSDHDALIAGEGIETMLSLRCIAPTLSMAAALSANHLSAMALPSGLRRLYIARDADAAGDAVQVTLAQRAGAAGIEAIVLSPRLGDFNEDLHVFGLEALRAALLIQLAPEDVDRFLLPSTAPG